MRLYYGHDPMCSFCWAFRPEWEKLKTALSEKFPRLEIVYLMGGLAPDTEEAMPESLQQKLQSTWRHIQELVPGTQISTGTAQGEVILDRGKYVLVMFQDGSTGRLDRRQIKSTAPPGKR